MIRRGARILVPILALTALAACDYLPVGYVPVGDIVAAPVNFEGKEVKLKGRVTSISRLPIVDFKSFVLKDGAAEIAVTTQGSLPAVNDEVKLSGTVNSAAIIGGQALGVHVKELKRLP